MFILVKLSFISLRHCASYTAVSDIVSDVTATEENLTEVFQKESVLNEEMILKCSPSQIINRSWYFKSQFLPNSHSC